MKFRRISVVLLLLLFLSSCALAKPVESDPVPSTTTEPATSATTTAPPPTSVITTTPPSPKLGWVEEDGKHYYYPQEDTPAAGWMDVAGKTYYFRSDGSMATGKVSIQGTNRFFAADGSEVLLVNPWNFIPEDYSTEVVTVEGWWWKSSTVCYDALMEMLQACKDAGLKPYIASAYRTHGDQVWLYNNKIQRLINEGYSKEEAEALAGTVVAVPGTSEHELGLAFDLADNDYRNLDEAQVHTPVQKWLMANSWRYGFVLRYPEGKSEYTGIIFEPWHYRYLGKDLAKELYESGMCLEEYLEALTTE